MKKIFLAVALMALACLVPSPAQAQTPVDLYVNYRPVAEDASLGQAYINETGRTMVPLRVVGDYLGYSTDWTPDGTIHVSDDTGRVDVTMRVGSLDYSANGQAASLGTAPLIREGRTYLPARDFAQIYGTIDWDQATQSVWIGDADTPLYRVEGTDLVRVTKAGRQAVALPQGQEVSVMPPDDPSRVETAKREADGRTYVAIQNHSKFTGLCDLYRDDGDHMTALGIQIHAGSSFAVQGEKVYSTLGTGAPGQGVPDASILVISTCHGSREVRLDFDVNACRLIFDQGRLVAIFPDGSRHDIDVDG